MNEYKAVAGTDHGHLQVWDLDKKEIIITLHDMLQQQQDISCFAVGANSIVTGSTDCTICLWN